MPDCSSDRGQWPPRTVRTRSQSIARIPFRHTSCHHHRRRRPSDVAAVAILVDKAVVVAAAAADVSSVAVEDDVVAVVEHLSDAEWGLLKM